MDQLVRKMKDVKGEGDDGEDLPRRLWRHKILAADGEKQCHNNSILNVWYTIKKQYFKHDIRNTLANHQYYMSSYKAWTIRI